MTDAALTPMMRQLRDRDLRTLVKAKRLFAEYAAPHGWDRVAHYCRIREWPMREWHGRWLFLATCALCAKRKGVPEAILWHLADPRHFICVYCQRYGKGTAQREEAT